MRDIKSFQAFFKKNKHHFSVEQLFIQSVEMIVIETLFFTHLSFKEIYEIRDQIFNFLNTQCQLNNQDFAHFDL